MGELGPTWATSPFAAVGLIAVPMTPPPRPSERGERVWVEGVG